MRPVADCPPVNQPPVMGDYFSVEVSGLVSCISPTVELWGFKGNVMLLDGWLLHVVFGLSSWLNGWASIVNLPTSTRVPTIRAIREHLNLNHLFRF